MTKIVNKKENKNNQNLILRYINYPDYIKDKNYYRSYIELVSKRIGKNISIYNFEVESKRRTIFWKAVYL